MNIGKLGVFYFLDNFSATRSVEFAQKIEKMGYGALWYPEAVGRNTMVTAAWLLAHTKTLVVASGIANIFARDAQATVAARKALDELSGGRYILGLGVSHAPLVQDMRGHHYSKPLARMRDYLEKMDQAVYQSVPPEKEGELVIGALGPKMTALSAELTDGAHPYNVTPEHTRKAREIVGPEKKVYVEQKVLLETDPEVARAKARESLSFYLGLPNYQKNWERLGFTKEDFENGSDRLMDAMVIWGNKDKVAAGIQKHFEAGADHVCLQPLGDSPLETLAELADLQGWG